MKYAIIQGNRVTDIITADESYYSRLQQIFPNVIETDNTTAIGWYYINNEFREYMQVALLTINMHKALRGKLLNAYNHYSPITMADGSLAISDEAIVACDNPDLQWLKNLPLIDYHTTQPDLTPPASDGVGLVITNAWRLGLPWPITLNGFEVPLKQTGTTYYIERSLYDWTAFKAELNKPINDDFKRLLTPFLNYLRDTAVRINL